MRVITGTLKGRKLFAVPGRNTRPTSDKIKETIFHKLGPYFEGGSALDLFAGSGALGIEAISRGIEQVIFIDQSPTAIKTIKKNVQALQIENQVTIYRNDAIKALRLLGKKRKQFNLILIDPPYDYPQYDVLLQEIIDNQLLHDEAFIYIEHRPSRKLTYDDAAFTVYYEKYFSKTTAATILQYTANNEMHDPGG